MPAAQTLATLLANTIPQGECLEWQGTFLGGGGDVPYVLHLGRSQGAHRLAYRLSGHDLPPGRLVYRTCANKKCIAPAHLAGGTMREVRALAKAHGRCYRNGASETHCKNGHPWQATDWVPGLEGQRRQCQRCRQAPSNLPAPAVAA